MILLVAIVTTLATIPLLHGSFARFGAVQVRWPAAAIAAIAGQFLLGVAASTHVGDTIGRVVHLASYLPAAAFLIANRRLAFLWIVGLGGAANLAAISANGGVMPASATALRTAGIAQAPGSFTNSTFVDKARLGFLGDVFAIPQSWPLSNVFSAGDVLIAVGFAVVVHAMAGSRLGRRQGQLPHTIATTAT
jgi:Family of unknown function (DUF5317)